MQCIFVMPYIHGHGGGVGGGALAEKFDPTPSQKTREKIDMTPFQNLGDEKNSIPMYDAIAKSYRVNTKNIHTLNYRIRSPKQ